MVLRGKRGTGGCGSGGGGAGGGGGGGGRNLTSKPPQITTIRAEIEGVPEERVYEALDLVAAAHRSGSGAADPFKNFVWNLKKPSRGRRNGRDASHILSGLDRMRD